MSGDMSGSTSPYTLTFTNKPIDTDAVTAIRVYEYDWYEETYYAIEFIKNRNSVVYPVLVDDLELRTDIWILETMLEVSAELANIVATNEYFKNPLITTDLILSGNMTGTVSTPYEIPFFNCYINTSLLKSVGVGEYDWYEETYHLVIFKFNIEDDEYVEPDDLEYQTNFWIFDNPTEMNDEFIRMSGFLNTTNPLRSVTVTASAGSTLTSTTLIGKTVVFIIMNDVVQQQGWTPTTINTTDTITFTDLVFAGGETVIIVYK